MDITIVLQQMLVLFSLMAVGFTLRKLKILTLGGNTLISHLILDVSVPAAVIIGVAGGAGDHGNLYLLYVLALCILIFAIVGVISAIAAKFTRIQPKEDWGALVSVGMFGNIVFMGFPIIIALFGIGSLFYGVLLNLAFNLYSFSIGVKLIAGARAKMSLRQICNLPMTASILAIGLFMLNIPIPELISIPLTHLGNMLTPLGMILLGSILAGMDVKEVFSGWRVYVGVFVKLLAAPVAVFLILSQFVTDPVMLSIFVILSAVPTAPRVVMFAVHYNGNVKLTGQGIFFSTILSVITIPLLIHLLGL